MAGVKVAYIRWRDACTEEAPDSAPVVPALAELQEIGFLLGETEEVVTIGMERGNDEAAHRWRLHIPKVNIIERYDFDLTQVYRPRVARRKRA